MARLHYRGFVINPMVTQLAESGRWSIGVSIERHSDTGINHRTFSSRDTHASKEDAIKASSEFGIRIVDGKVPGLSVDGL